MPSFSMPAMSRRSKILLSIVIVLVVIAIVVGSLVATGIIPMGRGRWQRTRPPGGGYSGIYYLKNSALQYVYFNMVSGAQVPTMYTQLTVNGGPPPYTFTPLPTGQYSILYSATNTKTGIPYATLTTLTGGSLSYNTPGTNSEGSFTITPVYGNYVQISGTDPRGNTYCLDTASSTLMSACNSASPTQMFTISLM